MNNASLLGKPGELRTNRVRACGGRIGIGPRFPFMAAPYKHKCFTEEHEEVAEAALIWLPSFPGSHSEQMIHVPRCTGLTQITLTTEKCMCISQGRKALSAFAMMFLYRSHDFHAAGEGDAQNVLELYTKVQCAFSESNQLRGTRGGCSSGSMVWFN